MAQQHNGLERVYQEVRAFVEARCGPGALPRDKFDELCLLGASEARRIHADWQEPRAPLLERLRALEERVEQLQAELEALRARVKRLEERQ